MSRLQRWIHFVVKITEVDTFVIQVIKVDTFAIKVTEVDTFCGQSYKRGSAYCDLIDLQTQL